MIKVMVVDDHRLIRRGIVMLLEKHPDLTVVGEAENGDEAILVTNQTKPDVILMDISMPNGLDGFTATEEILRDHQQIHIIFLSMHEEEEYIRRAIQVDGAGYILKNSQSSELHEAIRTVYNGKRYFNVGLPEEQLEKLFQNREKAPSILSVQERKVVRLSTLGFTNKQIGERLVISPKTVENHKTNIMNKLGLKNKSDLIKYALNNQYLQF